MRWFGTNERVRVSSDGATGIRLLWPDGREESIDIAAASLIGFVNVGEPFMANDEGWWLIGQGDGAIAISMLCAAVDPLLRDGPLAKVADHAPHLAYYDYASLPPQLRGADARDGVVRLDPDATRALRQGGIEVLVTSVHDFPRVN